MAQYLGSSIQQSLDSSSNPLSGGLMYVYQSPGTTTLLSLFSNEALSTPAANPIVADSSGTFAPVYVAETSAKLVLKTSAGVTVRTVDPVYSVGQADDVSAANVSYDGTAIGFSSTNLQDAIAELSTSFILAPPTTVDNTLPRFNGTYGQLQTTGIVVADTSYDVSGIGQITQTATGANTIPNGTTAQRPGSPATGMLRYNTTLSRLEYYNSGWLPVGNGGAPDAVLEDHKTPGTAGGTFTSGAWRTRTLNTVIRDPFGLITLSSDEFTPTVAGWVEWLSPAHEVSAHQTRLYNVTDTTATGYGHSSNLVNGNFCNNLSQGGAAVVAGKAYRIEHYCTATKSTTGFGTAFSQGVEVYTRVRFWRTA